MISFKEYILEYYKGNPILNVKMENGKKFDRAHMRKHVNTNAKEPEYKDPIIAIISSDEANNITRVVAGPRLHQLLSCYDTVFEPNVTKVLGNSNVSITMSIDSQGIQRGLCKNRKL